MAGEIKLKGFKEVAKTLKALPHKIMQNALRGGLRAGSKVFAQQMKFNINTRTGRLARSVRFYARVDNYTKLMTGKARVGTGKGGDPKAFYAHMVEFGTKAHKIQVRSPGVKALKGTNRRSVDHPGSAPRRFATLAFSISKSAALAKVQQYIRMRLKTKHGIDVPDPEAAMEGRP
jgi:HK97 gp10 family phage protein